jgi:hypothetical protein
MDNSYEDYNNKLENIIKNIKINNKKDTVNEVKIKKTVSNEKDFYCKQLDSLNYCLEMHKVRQNKKADFDIYSTLDYNIEDENIGKNISYTNWKDLEETTKNELIEEFINQTSLNYNLELKYTKEFVMNNLNKIKYDKYNKKIVDIQGMVNCSYNNKNTLKIKIKDKNTNNNISKLRKSLFNSKKK